jgi:hypothetical protein
LLWTLWIFFSQPPARDPPMTATSLPVVCSLDLQAWRAQPGLCSFWPRPHELAWSSQGPPQHCSQLLRVCRLRQLLRFSSFLKTSISLSTKIIIATIALRQLLQRVSALRQRLQLLRRMDCASYCNYCVYCGEIANSKLLGCRF